MIRRALVFLTVVAAVTGLMALGPAPATASHSWSNYHWARTSNPFTIQLIDSTTPNWDVYRTTASGDWEASSVLDTADVAGSDDRNTTKRCPAASGKVRVCNAEYGPNGWLGLAQVWLQSGTTHIVQGVAKMNDTYFNLAAYNNRSEKQHVMCQEVGHTFGLGHTSEDGTSQGTCMDYYRNATDDGISTHPNAHDYEQLEAIYAHLDSTSTVAALSSGSAASGEEGPNNRADWGRALGPTDRHGRPILFERTLVDGRRIISRVVWADPGAPGAPSR